ncbi:MAG: hypothetical protein HUJ77_08580 [Clostridium sp.]|uniref:hypothetical protein n=1 Tax=Clostridium sp. TaxID=1506 RepID=UPI0025BED94E|nr:hypothetical protein [Clostridium sp.]MCF0148439.1 hypothetical protein [Clostridium sp.]
MKNKKLLIVLMIVTSSIMVSCSSKILSGDKVIDSIVIDEDAKETANSNNTINITKIAITENLNGTRKGAILTGASNGKLIQIKLKENLEENKETQFPKEYIESLEVGTITEKIKDNRNVVTWENKDIDGQLIREYMGTEGKLRILKDNKVYELDENYNLKEATAYKKLIEDTNGDINRFELSYDENLEIYYMDNNDDKLGIIDTEYDKYYEINRKDLGNMENKRLNILMAENNKIYLSIVDTANKETSTIGYIKDNKLTTFFDENSVIKVRVTGDVIYSNNNILFSGYVEDDYGIWNYNTETKKLEKQVKLKSDFSYFKVSKDKSFIIIENMNFYEDYSINIARIDDNLKISNIQELTNSILPNRSISNSVGVTTWSNNENKFYVGYVKDNMVDGRGKIDNLYLDVYYEIYEVK